MKKTLLLLVLGVFGLLLFAVVLFPAHAFAQSEVQTVATQAAVADVNLGDVTFTKKNGTYTGSFSLQAKMGQQNDIAYGVIVYDDKNNIVDAKHIGEVDVLKEGELKYLGFTYMTPGYIQGDVKMFLVAETKDGLPLGSFMLEPRITLRGTGRTLLCSSITKGLSCEFKAATTITITKQKALFGDPVGEVLKVSGKKGDKKDIEIKGDAGSYYLIIENTSADERKILKFKITGTYGNILNVAVSSKEKGKLDIVATIKASPLVGTKLAYNLTDTNKMSCGKGEISVNTPAVSASIDTSCKEGNMNLMLLGSDGKVLDVKDEGFSVINTADESAAKQNMMIVGGTLKNFVVALAGLCLLGLLLIVFRKKIMNPKILLLLLASTILIAPKADALTVITSGLGPPGCGSCENSVVTYAVFTLNKSSYTPGESIGVSVSLNANHDVDVAYDGWSSHLQVPSNAGGTAPDFDNGASYTYASPGYAIYDGGGAVLSDTSSFIGSGSGSFTAPAALGTHTIPVNNKLSVSYPPGFVPMDLNFAHAASMSFTVATATTVNVFFSYLASAVKAWL